jgi:hypothetical protein
MVWGRSSGWAIRAYSVRTFTKCGQGRTSEEMAEVDSSQQLTQSSVGSVGRYDDVSFQHMGALGRESTCDGPGIALVSSKFVDLYQELGSVNTHTARTTARCCDSCGVFVLRALTSLKAGLVLCVQRCSQSNKGPTETRRCQDKAIKAKLDISQTNKAIMFKACFPCKFRLTSARPEVCRVSGPTPKFGES